MTALASLRCVVLGGGGFIGTNLCKRLSGRAASVRAFGRGAPAVPIAGVDWLTGELDDPSAIAAAVQDGDTVFHLIGDSTPAGANLDPVGDARSSVIGALRLLDACRAAGVRRIVFASSGGTVYGPESAIPTPEDAPTWPISAYGVSKLAVERYLHLYAHLYGLEYRILRIANPFGPHQTAARGQGVIAAFLQRALGGQPLKVWGDGSVRRDYVYVEDVADALERAAVHEGAHRLFNIGGGRARSLNEIIDAISALLGGPLAVERGEGRPVDVPVSQLDISRARQDLGWVPQTSFADGLARTLDWMREELERGELRP